MKFTEIFKYQPTNGHEFTLTPIVSNDVKEHDSEKKISTSIDLNLKYIKNKYSTLINSDIMIREFSLTARNTRI